MHNTGKQFLLTTVFKYIYSLIKQSKCKKKVKFQNNFSKLCQFRNITFSFLFLISFYQILEAGETDVLSAVKNTYHKIFSSYQ